LFVLFSVYSQSLKRTYGCQWLKTRCYFVCFIFRIFSISKENIRVPMTKDTFFYLFLVFMYLEWSQEKKKISLHLGIEPTTYGNLQQWRTDRLTDHEFLHTLTLFKAPKFDKLVIFSVIFQSFSQLQILVSRCSDVLMFWCSDVSRCSDLLILVSRCSDLLMF